MESVNQKTIYIIIPAYNEEGNIAALLGDIKALILPYEKKVIMVDDGSTDKTLSIAQTFLSKMDLTIVKHHGNKGVPQTFYDGLSTAAARARGDDILCIIEGDGTSNLALIPNMITAIEKGADVVVASRYITGGGYKNFPLHRTLGSKFINTTLKIFFYTKGVTDYTIFYRVYRASVIQQALRAHHEQFITTKSFAANLEVLLKTKPFARRYVEVPLVYDYGLKKSQSKMRVFKTLFEYKTLITKKVMCQI